MTTEPKGRSKTEFSIRNEDDWDAIYEKLEQARTKYQNEGGKVGWLRKVRRKAADHVAPGAEIAKNVGKLVPDNPYSTPIAGAVQVLLDAVSTAAKVRGQVLQGFEGLIPIFSDVEVFLGTFPEDLSIRNAAVELTVTTLEAIERAIGFFISNEVLRSFKAVGMDAVYESELVQSLEAINEKSKRFMEEAQKSHFFEFHMYSKETRKFAQQMIEQQQELGNQYQKLGASFTHAMHFFNDHVKEKDREIAMERERHRQEMKAAQQENIFLRVENVRLRSVTPPAQSMWAIPPPQSLPASECCGGRSMIASLIDQLLRQCEFDTRSLAMDGINFERLQLGDLEELIRLLEWLVRRLPETITFVCLIDGVILYERDEMEALEALAGLIRLANDENLRAAVKLLFTSTPGTDIVRSAFEEEYLILNVDGLPKLVWAPSDERVSRELGMNIEGQ
ncbi:hypothetical protein G7Z17_g1417 [Cylindrodendrum hubeiense]|uniref:Uncharacterized protein n=1 Tax=Cylindrodendrum hubeiense TaxID=595255 RepID=A0A9P5HLI0_9HYPO|nr:hypothetical protein G7Z17_g1417 [Cylindrodendrum hubeiense]